MKFSLLIVALASASALTLQGPNEADIAFQKERVVAAKTVADQQAYEAKKTADIAAAFAADTAKATETKRNIDKNTFNTHQLRWTSS